jgi:hypothetical protein
MNADNDARNQYARTGTLEPLTPSRAKTLYLQSREEELADRSLTLHEKHITSFEEWCDENDHDNMNDVTAALEREGLMVACRGESAFYNAEEARNVAAGLERATSDDPRHETIADLIAFLRYGANVLDEDNTRRGLHVEFAKWR